MDNNGNAVNFIKILSFHEHVIKVYWCVHGYSMFAWFAAPVS